MIFWYFISHLCWLLIKPPLTYQTETGTVRFVSDARLERIEAANRQMRGVITSEGRFAFSCQTIAFEGFNSALQREHFNENYLESTKNPTMEFSGRFIGELPIGSFGTHEVRAKGQLKIHGVQQERIIKGMLQVRSDGRLQIKSRFTILLSDHQIEIPRIVFQKIAEEITVEVEAELAPKK